MTREIWFISDTHFGHDHIIPYGERPFANVAEMDEALATNWSERVKDEDLVYHLGDIAWTHNGLRLFEKLPGTKRLMLGNHDHGKECAPLVQRLELYREFDDEAFVASHMPLFPELGLAPINVHGHVHHIDVGHPRYVNISVEKTQYRPLHIDEVRKLVADAKAAVDKLALVQE